MQTEKKSSIKLGRLSDIKYIEMNKTYDKQVYHINSQTIIPKSTYSI